MSEHQAAMIEDTMATSDQMMRGVMADDPDIAFACGMIRTIRRRSTWPRSNSSSETTQHQGHGAVTIDEQTTEIEQLATWIEEHVQ